MNCFYLLVLLMCCSCQNQTDCANWNGRRDADWQQETRDRDCGCRSGDRAQTGCGCENGGWTGQSDCGCQRENAAGMQRRSGESVGRMSEQPDCGCQQMQRQGGMQRYDRELKESAAFDSVPGMEMTDGHPYPVYRETDEVR